MKYAELQVTSNFSFLRGASHPEELVEQAAALNYQKIALTDRNSLAGIVRAHIEAKKHAVQFIPGCRLDLLDGPSLLAYPTDKEAYSRLSGILSTGNQRAEKGECHLFKADLYQAVRGMKLILVPPPQLDQQFRLDEDFDALVREYHEAFGTDLYLGISRTYTGNDHKRLFRIAGIGKQYGIALAATNDVHYHHPSRRELQDVLTCVREKCTIHTAGFRLHQNAERYLKPVEEMHRLFRLYPEALENTLEIAEACTFSLDSLQYVYPVELCSEGRSPQEELSLRVWEGAAGHWGTSIPAGVAKTIREELRFIEKKNYASYFLTVYDYVRFAREQNILCQGRGSAANSVVCYCLGITSVDPTKFKLLFARFMSEARDEPPDIDVDFEHERREEVIQYIYQKYGRDRAAIVATVTQERHKGAIRDVGRAMGLSVDTINRLSASVWEFSEDWYAGKMLKEQGLNPDDPVLHKTLELTGQLLGFPRQLGQHTGGFVITQGQLSDLCPIMNARMENRTCIEWNKDDIEALGFMKVDVLGLGMLTCIRKAFDLARIHYGKNYTLANIPQDDPEVYEMICRADTLGVFQIESRAQMSMLPRLRPRKFYDLVIEVAIVRPGPIQGDMVHPYLRRRDGLEKVEYPSEELKEILGRTLGVPLFQEQAMEIAIVAAGFTPAEADGLRRSMATFKAKGQVSQFEKKLIKGMISNGYDQDFARKVFRQLEGFGSYGFPESHAASFALLVYVSSWLKCHHPDVFATALLNSMPMGFYQPAQIVIDARKHGVEVRPADINHSMWDNTLEEPCNQYRAIRLGFRQITGFRQEDAQKLIEGRKTGYTQLHQLMDCGLTPAALERLADADAFRSISLDRRQALWEVSALHDRPLALFEGQPSPSSLEGQITLPFMSEAEHVIQDYATTTLSLKAHPVSFVRPQLEMLRVIPAAKLPELRDGDKVRVSGLITVRQRPGTAKGVLFITIEDESGFCNLVVFQNVFSKYRKEILQARLLMVEGQVQIEKEVIHVIVKACWNLSHFLRKLTQSDADPLNQPLSRSDETVMPAQALTRRKAPTENEVFYGGRNFR